MKQYFFSPSEIFVSIWRNRALLSSLVKREIQAKYKGSALGILWSYITPVVLLILYTFVFGFIFESKWNQEQTSRLEFALILFSGLIVFNIFSEGMIRAPNLITSHPNFVKKVVFPLEILSTASICSSLFNWATSFVIYLSAFVIMMGTPPLTALLAPVLIVPIVLISLGLSWFLSSLGVYLRDIGHLIGLIVTVNLFTSAVFYPLNAIPENFRSIIALSPLTQAIESFRQAVFFGHMPNWSNFLVQLCVSLLIALGGFMWFQKTRKGFADVI
jgi:lipopolysaccharide transport system permease protein